ncbi:MAG: T9SS type A sorting domain-containing protein [Sphingobacteriales bacterium]|nr:MAG: T9SS type A sorting domain-containing protein [Sphingobacteriales bacterium]
MQYQFLKFRNVKQAFAIFAFLLVTNCESLLAQSSAYSASKAKWIFGKNAQISFNPDGTYTVGAGPTSPSGTMPFYAGEGSASVSDRCNGNLLFYTNGMKIWRANGTLMNSMNDIVGNRLNPIHQTWSSTQGAVIIPVPGNKSKYYVISGDDREEVVSPGNLNSTTGYAQYGLNRRFASDGMRVTYTIVDMDRITNGTGDIALDVNNTPIVNKPILNADGSDLINATEKMTVTLAANGRDYWLVLHRTYSGAYNAGTSPAYSNANPKPNTTCNTFIVYNVNANGINFCSEYNVGPSREYYNNANSLPNLYYNENPQGYMKLSPDGRTIAMAMRGSRRVELYNFNNRTGAITFRDIIRNNAKAEQEILNVYGLSFSSNGQYLYAAENHGNAAVSRTTKSDYIYQIDVSTNQVVNTFQLQAWNLPSGAANGSTTHSMAGALQLATDGNIYFVQMDYYRTVNYTSSIVTDANTSISRINNSDFSNASISENVLTFTKGNEPQTGLPNMIDAPADKCITCPNTIDANIYTQHPNNETLNSNTVWKGKHYVEQKITVNSSATLDLTGVDIVFAPGAGIIVNSGALIAINSTFHSCETDVWAGFEFRNGTWGSIEECQFLNADKGIFLTQTANVRITNNLFRNNRIGVHVDNTSSNTLLAYTEAISGNTFLKDAVPLVSLGSRGVCDPYSENYYGIYAAGRNFTEKITQNDFIFTGREATLQFCGVYWSKCGGTISQNNFSNMYRSVMAEDNRAYTTIENNKIEVTGNTGSNTAVDHFQIFLYNNTIVSGEGAILVSNNKLNCNIPVNNNYNFYGIYTHSTSNTIIQQNEINGFDYSIYADNTKSTSPYYLSAGSITISDNKIENGGKNGISLISYFGSNISNNIIKMRSGNMVASPGVAGITKFGIYYDHSTGENVANSINGNCIYDCNLSIFLTPRNIVLPFPLIIIPTGPGPSITNNYLYNYSVAGIYLDNSSAIIGTGCAYNTQGRNTFACNYRYLSPEPYDIYSNMAVVNNQPVLTVYGNEYIIDGTNNSQNWASSYSIAQANCGNEIFPSFTTCGNRVKKESIEPVDNTQIYYDNLLAKYPLKIVNNSYRLTSGYMDSILAQDINHRSQYVKNIMNLLSHNPDESQVDNFYSQVNSFDLSAKANDLLWVKYVYYMLKNNISNSIAVLNEMKPIAVDEKDLITVEKIRCKLFAEKKAASEMLFEDKNKLVFISNSNSQYSNNAKSLLIQGFQNEEIVFNIEPIKKVTPLETVKGKIISPNAPCLLIYPNPATNYIMLNYSTNNAENAVIKICDLAGKEVLRLPVVYSAANIKVDISFLNAGSYILTLEGKDGIIEKGKMVVYK